MNKKLFEAICKWQTETFRQATALSKILHLKQEIEELIIEIKFDGIDKKLEFADCFILLFGAASSEGMTYEDICNAIQEKFEINKTRKWGKADKNGIVKHIKD